jgi:hypothetical protein
MARPKMNILGSLLIEEGLEFSLTAHRFHS